MAMKEAIAQLQQQRNDLQQQVAKLDQAIQVLQSLGGGNAPAPKAAAAPKQRKGPKISAAGIAKIRAAQKARWAKIHAERAAAAAK